MFIEYPKMLYPQGDPTAQWQLAQSAEHEAALRELGYCVVGEEPKEQKRKPGRPRKTDAQIVADTQED